jgi:hypothetical protein
MTPSQALINELLIFGRGNLPHLLHVPMGHVTKPSMPHPI